MPKFVLVEPALYRMGGHFYEYSVQILKAAEEAGFTPHIAIHQRFDEEGQFPQHWHVHREFPYDSNRIYKVPRAYTGNLLLSVLKGQKNITDSFFTIIDGVGNLFKTAISRLRFRRHRIRSAGYVQACQRIFDKIELEHGDHVFCSTMSDADFRALSRFLKEHPQTQVAQWHLQFHFGIFAGRPSGYQRQIKAAKPLAQLFRKAIADIPDHSIQFYTTTDQLNDQYTRLDVAPFATLPWSVSDRFQRSHETTDQQRPLRLVLAGGSRREKGGDHVRELVDRLWDDYLKPGKLQLVLQSNEKKRTLSMLDLPAEHVAHVDDVEPSQYPNKPIVLLPHPLDDEQFARHIESADIGLLLYDSKEYFARCSGILVELMTAGVPVIAPNGCWISQTLATANQSPLAEIFASEERVQTCQTDVGQWSKGATHVQRTDSKSIDRLMVDDVPCSTELSICGGGAPFDLLCGFDWCEKELGAYIQVEIEQFDAQRKVLHSQICVVEPAAGETSRSRAIGTLGRDYSCAIVELHGNVESVRISLQTTLDSGAAEISPPVVNQISCLPSGNHRPSGQVGLTFSNRDEIPAKVREMFDAIEHYQANANEHAAIWKQKFDPMRAIEVMVGRERKREDDLAA